MSLEAEEPEKLYAIHWRDSSDNPVYLSDGEQATYITATSKLEAIGRAMCSPEAAGLETSQEISPLYTVVEKVRTNGDRSLNPKNLVIKLEEDDE